MPSDNKVRVKNSQGLPRARENGGRSAYSLRLPTGRNRCWGFATRRPKTPNSGPDLRDVIFEVRPSRPVPNPEARVRKPSGNWDSEIARSFSFSCQAVSRVHGQRPRTMDSKLCSEVFEFAATPPILRSQASIALRSGPWTCTGQVSTLSR
jgi:hypothetical protein